MTAEEALIELKKQTTGTVHVREEHWHFDASKREETICVLNFHFTKSGCSSISAPSFEECFATLNSQNSKINEVLSKYSILLRQF